MLDEAGAVSGTRPLEQVADVCQYGWGGSAYQASADQRVLCVLGQYAGLLTPAQAHWHPRRGELSAQREVARARRKHLGRVPALCWSDHKHLMRDVVAPDADPMTIRWISDLEGPGDRLRNLSGRACLLADRQSRKHEDHAEFLRKAASRLKGLTLDDILDSDRGSDDEEPWAIGSHAAPQPSCKKGGAAEPIASVAAAAIDASAPFRR